MIYFNFTHTHLVFKFITSLRIKIRNQTVDFYANISYTFILKQILFVQKLNIVNEFNILNEIAGNNIENWKNFFQVLISNLILLI